MSLADAMAFLREARHDERLGTALEALGDDATWAALADVAGEAGRDCTPEELTRAHALDWGMRWARFVRPR